MATKDPLKPPMHRINVLRSTSDLLVRLFPDVTQDEAIQYLISRHGKAIVDTAACDNTELWIKMDRLDEIIRLLAMSNVDVADIYRRSISGELARMKAATLHMAGLLKDKFEAQDSDSQTL